MCRHDRSVPFPEPRDGPGSSSTWRCLLCEGPNTALPYHPRSPNSPTSHPSRSILFPHPKSQRFSFWSNSSYLRWAWVPRSPSGPSRPHAVHYSTLLNCTVPRSLTFLLSVQLLPGSFLPFSEETVDETDRGPTPYPVPLSHPHGFPQDERPMTSSQVPLYGRGPGALRRQVRGPTRRRKSSGASGPKNRRHGAGLRPVPAYRVQEVTLSGTRMHCILPNTMDLDFVSGQGRSSRVGVGVWCAGERG